MRYLTIQNERDTFQVSGLVLGSNYFGTVISESDSFAMMDYFFEHQGNCIDTARSYANWLPDGESASERMVGRWMRGVERDKVVISTKGGLPDGINQNPGAPVVSRITRKDLYEDLSKSLDVLGTDYIDLYWLHRDDPGTPVGEIVELVNEFIQKGYVRAVGASNWSVERIAEANAYAKRHGLSGFSMSQIQWSLASCTPESWGDDTLICMNDEEYRWYLENKFPVMAFSSQAKGIFSKSIEQGMDSLSEKVRTRFLNESNIRRIERVRVLCDRYGVSPATVCLSYILSNPVPGAAIIGCSNPSQLADSMRSGDFVLSMEDIQYLTQD
ncbi:aldo/keto reductase [Candidatus Soleaferrea massiliensis]|uniref:aldo/keto reductase n=1 Tax=Candidatus Soleaferrea massiliensis TaxID=1470354 RepID=UPI00058BB614|nr:aldo/keto reductase [Candidatus Soleaferrea massiliensis]